MIGRTITRFSAAVLALGGATLLFAPEAILPRLVPGVLPASAWLGQLVAAGWLAVAAANWFGQHTLIGGIYSRPLVMTNLALYLVTATSIVRPALVGRSPALLWGIAATSVAFAGMYAWLMLRGPFARDFDEVARESRRAASGVG
jgi:hypothetical protein